MSRQSDMDNHANQMNPNNEVYWESRGYEECPDDWEEKVLKKKEESRENRPPAPKH